MHTWLIFAGTKIAKRHVKLKAIYCGVVKKCLYFRKVTEVCTQLQHAYVRSHQAWSQLSGPNWFAYSTLYSLLFSLLLHCWWSFRLHRPFSAPLTSVWIVEQPTLALRKPNRKWRHHNPCTPHLNIHAYTSSGHPNTLGHLLWQQHSIISALPYKHKLLH